MNQAQGKKMETIETISEMQTLNWQWRQAGRRVALVPTMGALHEGHLSLIRRAREKADTVVVSVFVNPSQFGENEDFSTYPRDFRRDWQLCREQEVDAVFHPAPEEMYPPDFSTWVDERELATPLCGQFRPGHFRGVATIVVKLCNAVLPDVTVFGQKDAQQALVLKRVLRDLNMPTTLEIAPIVREHDGLAMSSRNQYLTADQRWRARSINQGLELARQHFAKGERNASTLIDSVKQKVKAAGGDIQYAEVRDRNYLQPLKQIDRPALLAVAAFFGQCRLIDNCFLNHHPCSDTLNPPA